MPLIKPKSKRPVEADKADPAKSLAVAYSTQRSASANKPQGPAMQSDDETDTQAHYASIADAILAKKRKAMADGGQVELDNKEEPMEFDELTEEAADEPVYGDDDEEDESDKRDVVSAVRKRMKSRG